MRLVIFRWLLIFAALVLSACQAAPAGSTLDQIKQRGELVIGTDATYPPFENKVGEEFVGFDIDLGRAIAEQLGVKARFVNASFDGIFPALLAGKYDMVISSVTITPERQKSMAFSDPYYNAGQQIAVRKDSPEIKTLEDLNGKSVGIQINTTAQVVLEKRPGVTLRKYNSIDLALLDLTNGKIDAVVSDAPTLQVMLRQNYPTLALRGRPFTEEHYGIAMRPADQELVAAVNAALANIRKNGTYEKLQARYFGAEAATAEPQRSESALSFKPALVAQVWPIFLHGLRVTVLLAFAGLFFGLPLGLLLALARVSGVKALALAALVYIEIIRGTPLLVQIFFLYFVLPAFGVSMPESVTAVLALSLNASAYIAEIFRSAILSVPRGQMEAARSLGMGYFGAMQLVVLPQAVVRAIPPLTNEAVALLKDSSLVSIMGMTELTRTGQELASRYADPVTVWLTVAVLYLLLTIPLTQLAGWLERKWVVGQR